jgi:carboxypeptidase family protein
MRIPMRTTTLVAVCLLTCATAQAGGSIAGVVRYEGEAPAPKKWPVTVDAEVCGAQAVSEDLALGKKGGVRDVVVSLAGTFEGAPSMVKPPAGFSFNDKGCRLDPHVLIVPAGSDIAIVNADHLNHSFRTYSRTNPPQSVALPKTSTRAMLHLDYPENIEIRCEVHEWEKARIVVAARPYNAVTDLDGRFEIKDVPAGDYTIGFWQESLGSETRRIQVREGETLRLDIPFGQKVADDFPTDPEDSPEAAEAVSRLDVNVLPITTTR